MLGRPPNRKKSGKLGFRVHGGVPRVFKGSRGQGSHRPWSSSGEVLPVGPGRAWVVQHDSKEIQEDVGLVEGVPRVFNLGRRSTKQGRVGGW